MGSGRCLAERLVCVGCSGVRGCGPAARLRLRTASLRRHHSEGTAPCPLLQNQLVLGGIAPKASLRRHRSDPTSEAEACATQTHSRGLMSQAGGALGVAGGSCFGCRRWELFWRARPTSLAALEDRRLAAHSTRERAEGYLADDVALGGAGRQLHRKGQLAALLRPLVPRAHRAVADQLLPLGRVSHLHALDLWAVAAAGGAVVAAENAKRGGSGGGAAARA